MSAAGVGVLQGIRVLDFGRYIAGPYCAALLGEYGAEVIRIDRRGGSEDRYTWPVTDRGEGTNFLQMNRNKRSITLDPVSEGGREVVRRLVASADVVVANLPPATLAAMRLDWPSLSAVKPDVILATVTAYGPSGPWRDRVGFDGIGQAMSGAVYMSGTPDRPSRSVVPWADFGTALHLACGTLVALMARARTGKGQVVEGALLATSLAFNNAMLAEQAVTARDRVPTGNRAQIYGPTDVFRTRDGWIVCQIIGNPQFRKLATLLGEAGWLEDPRFRDDASRGEHRDVLCERMARWCGERTSAEALDALAGASLPAGPVLKPQETLDHPQVNGLGLFEDLAYPGLPRPAPIARVPVWLSETPGSIRSRPPTAGEHTDAILAELGYSAAEIERLRREGAV
jgi:crotonobetainyl-CoA:carnitine CoA-transferase CaiB-like acyl-CoA transferase